MRADESWHLFLDTPAVGHVLVLQAVIERTAAAAASAAGRGPGTREGSTAQMCRAGELRLIESRDCFVDPKITVFAESV